MSNLLETALHLMDTGTFDEFAMKFSKELRKPQFLTLPRGIRIDVYSIVAWQDYDELNTYTKETARVVVIWLNEVSDEHGIWFWDDEAAEARAVLDLVFGTSNGGAA